MKVQKVERKINMHSVRPVQYDVSVENTAPCISSNNTWMVYDYQKDQFIDTGVKATGPKGDAYEITDDDYQEIAEKTKSDYGAELDDYVTNAVSAKNSAQEYASAASASKASASSFATSASNSAYSALESKESATASASGAAASASSALSNANRARSAAESAESYATSAQSSAASAASSASSAASSATSAQAYAASAQEYAAELTAQKIANVLGYTPADAEGLANTDQHIAEDIEPDINALYAKNVEQDTAIGGLKEEIAQLGLSVVNGIVIDSWEE